MNAVAETIRRHAYGFSCRTGRTAAFQDVVGSLIRPAIVRADSRGSYDFEVEHLRLEHLEITVLRYGDPMEIDLRQPGAQTGSDLVLQMVVAGTSESHLGNDRRVTLSRSRGHLVGSDLPMRVHCGRNCRHFLVRFDRSALEHTALTFDQPLQIPDPRSAVSLASSEGRALRRYVRYLVSELGHAGPLQTSGQFLRATQQSLLALMLDSFASAPAAKGPPRIATTPHCVRRAEEFIAANLSEDIGLSDIVANAGVSRRTLYRSFEQSRGITPLGFLREQRLDKAHAEMVDSDAGYLRVIDVAFRWGFPHLSAFASLYRTKFGCLPSDTLRQTRESARRLREPQGTRAR